MIPSVSGGVNIAPAQKLFQTVQVRAADLRNPFHLYIDPSVVEFFRRQFASKGAEGKTPWAPLKASTIKRKSRANRGNMGILRFSNRLWASLTKRGGPEVILNITPKLYQRGTSVVADSKKGPVPYPAIHQTGSQDGRIPARPLVPDEMPANYLQKWGAIIAQHLEGKKA